MKEKSQNTPIIQQYLDIKKSHEDELLFFRVGDFYELFYDDARRASEILKIQLTARINSGESVPMAGVPHHAANSYLKQLLESGQSIAICEQFNESESKNSLIERKVVRVLTPGTAIEEDIIEDHAHQYLAAVFPMDEACYSLAFCAINEGSIFLIESCSSEMLLNQLDAFNPKEIILFDQENYPQEIFQYHVLFKPKWLFDISRAERMLKQESPHLLFYLTQQAGRKKIQMSHGLAGLINYLKLIQINFGQHLKRIVKHEDSSYLKIDRNTRKSLEIFTNIKGGKEHTLFDLLNKTKTAMGARALRFKLTHVHYNPDQTMQNHGIIEAMIAGKYVNDLQVVLHGFADIERIGARIHSKNEKPADLIRLGKSFDVLPRLMSILEKDSAFQSLADLDISPYAKIKDQLDRALVDDVSISLKQGGVIRTGYHDELDRMRQSINETDDQIQAFELMERERTQINSLKIAFNNLLGFYIEIPKSKIDQVPVHYKEIQTLKNALRFHSEKLERFANRIAEARTRSLELEKEIYQMLLNDLLLHTENFDRLALWMANLDVLIAFSSLAEEFNWTAPIFERKTQLLIEAGEHPIVVNQNRDDVYVSNDLKLDQTQSMMVITGANMGGKSTYMRQSALILILAYIGSFVPCKKAIVGHFDAIFTRIGSSDDLAAGQSTFMVEMLETANIMHHATQKSLVLVDEIGRGTSSHEGFALAYAIAEYLANHVHALTLFATHYLDIAKLPERFSQVKSIYLATRYDENKLFFTYQVKSGIATSSHALDVAKMAGMPLSLLERATHYLKNDREETEEQGNLFKHDPSFEDKGASVPYVQQDQSTQSDDQIASSTLDTLLKWLNVDEMTPKDALDYLYKLKKLAQTSEGNE